MNNILKSFILIIVSMSFFISCQPANLINKSTSTNISVVTKVSPFRVKPGETVVIESSIKSKRKIGKIEIKAELLIPCQGQEPLKLIELPSLTSKEKTFRGEIKINLGMPEGLYVITVSANQKQEQTISKASFLFGKMIGDFMILSSFSEQDLEKDMRAYLEDFKKLGGNLLIIHSLITSKKAYYPSQICSLPAKKGSPDDRIGLALTLAAEYGFSSLLSASWDLTRKMPYSECLDSTKEIIDELWKLYGTEPSLVGFYNYQEGSGTYLVWQMREFTSAVKAKDPGLLTACAPYLDDPLLAGYLASIDNLDIVIYQGAVMASYRKDNRRCFPYRRVKDFASLAAGGTKVRNKITLSHVELFGYLEKQYADSYLASPEDIYRQILSAASCHGPEGIIFFTYHFNIYEYGKKLSAAKESKKGVEQGLKAFQLIANKAAQKSSHIGLYIPYNDWWADRWTATVAPALDAFRSLGLNSDILPFIPRAGEEILPYYPYHSNQEHRDFLLNNRYVLVLSDIAGMQDPDSQMLKEFVQEGGVVIFFGPSIPYGDQFEREELCGGTELSSQYHNRLKIEQEFGMRVKKGRTLNLTPIRASSWNPGKATILASFEDGKAAIMVNNFGQGLCLTVPLNLRDLAMNCPELALDLIDYALARIGIKRGFDLLNSKQDLDIAESIEDKTRYLSVINHQDLPHQIKFVPLNLEPNQAYEIKNELNGQILFLDKGRLLKPLAINVPARDYILISCSKKVAE